MPLPRNPHFVNFYLLLDIALYTLARQQREEKFSRNRKGLAYAKGIEVRLEYMNEVWCGEMRSENNSDCCENVTIGSDTFSI
jgi:hypothetical protein